MTDQRGVDVLNVLRKFERTYMLARLHEEAEDIAAIFAAVSELIESCKERDEADGKYGAAEAMHGENSNAEPMREARGRIMRANKRYLAALSDVTKGDASNG